MKRVAHFLAAGFLLAACSEAPVSPKAPSDLHPNFAAVTTTESFRFPEEFVVPAGTFDCTAEDIHFTGTTHVVLHTTSTPSGKYLERFTVNDQNYAGVGLTTGTRYRRVGATNRTFQINSGLPVVLSFTETFDFIGQGSAPKLLLHGTFHVTINALGVVTAVVEKDLFECK